MRSAGCRMSGGCALISAGWTWCQRRSTCKLICSSSLVALFPSRPRHFINVHFLLFSLFPRPLPPTPQLVACQSSSTFLCDKIPLSAWGPALPNSAIWSVAALSACQLTKSTLINLRLLPLADSTLQRVFRGGYNDLDADDISPELYKSVFRLLANQNLTVFWLMASNNFSHHIKTVRSSNARSVAQSHRLHARSTRRSRFSARSVVLAKDDPQIFANFLFPSLIFLPCPLPPSPRPEPQQAQRPDV